MAGERNLSRAEIQALNAAARLSLSPRGGIALDGTTGAKATVALGAAGAIGSDPASLVMTMNAPNASGPGLAIISSSATGYAGTSLALLIIGTSLVIQLGPDANYNRATIANFVTNFGGKITQLAFVRNASGNPDIYINGVLQIASFTTNGTPPTWQASLSATYLTIGTGYGGAEMKSPIYSVSLYNLALSAADVQEIYELGGAVPERFKFGSQASLYSSNFSAGVDGWGTDSSRSVTGNIDQDADGAGLPPSNDWLKAAVTASAPLLYTYRTGLSLARRSAFRIRATVVKNATVAMTHAYALSEVGVTAGATTIADKRQIVAAFSGAQAVLDGVVLVLNVVNGLAPVIGTCNSAGIPNGEATGSAIYLKDVIIQQVGAVVHLPLDDGSGLQLRDASTNQLHALMTTSGVSHLLTDTFQKRVQGSTNTNGNQQLLGQNVIPTHLSAVQIIRIRARAASGTPTVTVGNASGGSQYVTSVGLTTSWKELTIVAAAGLIAFTGSSAIWIGSNSTDIIYWDIVWEPMPLL